MVEAKELLEYLTNNLNNISDFEAKKRLISLWSNGKFQLIRNTLDKNGNMRNALIHNLDCRDNKTFFVEVNLGNFIQDFSNLYRKKTYYGKKLNYKPYYKNFNYTLHINLEQAKIFERIFEENGNQPLEPKKFLLEYYKLTIANGNIHNVISYNRKCKNEKEEENIKTQNNNQDEKEITINVKINTKI